MKPRVCEKCSAVLGREIRHLVRRLCSQVQGERRRQTDPHRRAMEAARQRENRRVQREMSSLRPEER